MDAQAKAMQHYFDIINEIGLERDRQDQKWGVQNHHPAIWMTILTEEVGEAAKAAVETIFEARAQKSLTRNHNKELVRKLSKAYRDELIQVAAVAVAMIENLDRVDPTVQNA